MLKTLVIIPAFNEEMNIENVINDIKNNAPQVDYLIVNDGSKDNTMKIVREKRFNCIDSFVNLGLWGAVQTGFKYAVEYDYDVAIQFDGDGQHTAEYIEKLVKEIELGSNIVIGSRFAEEKKPFTARMLGSRLISLAIRLTTGKKISDPTSGMRAYDKSTILDYATDMNNPPEPDTLVYMIRKKRNVKEVQVEMSDREFGESVFNFSHTINYMSRIMISIFMIQPFRKVK